ncbi:MAG: hypothetical protein PF961_09960 [Planctomycetota bacterium]|jgi:hypothetical protein|nr:hypothetical protein [Planctomycetota bacterium]
MADRYAVRLLVLALVLAIVGLAAMRADPSPDHRLPHNSAEPWMADALPGVGITTKDAVAAQIRAGDPEALPKRARETAKAVFSW